MSEHIKRLREIKSGSSVHSAKSKLSDIPSDSEEHDHPHQLHNHINIPDGREHPAHSTLQLQHFPSLTAPVQDSPWSFQQLACRSMKEAEKAAQVAVRLRRRVCPAPFGSGPVQLRPEADWHSQHPLCGAPAVRWGVCRL